MLEDLTRVSEYAWGPMALATLYDELAQASRHTTMQMGGYTSLLLAWAFEHFPSTMIYRVENPVYTEDQPRACRWIESRSGHLPVSLRRVHFDDATADIVTWTPYEEHRGHRPMDVRALYSGYIRAPSGTVRPHLPERVLRQFGYIQTIPRHPRAVLDTPATATTTDAAFSSPEAHLIPDGMPVGDPGETVADYMDWYASVSHRYIIPDTIRPSLSVMAGLSRVHDLIEQGLDVDDAPHPGTQSHILLSRALEFVTQMSMGPVIYARAAMGGGRGGGRGGRRGGGRGRSGAGRGAARVGGGRRGRGH